MSEEVKGISPDSCLLEDQSEGATGLNEIETLELAKSQDHVGIRSALMFPQYLAHSWQPSPNQHSWGGRKPTHVAIHTIQGSYSGCISWFKQKRARVSAHYVVSEQGHTTQMVGEHRVAWHVGGHNGYTIGIEHEGYAHDGVKPSEPLLHASAKLTAGICMRNNIPMDANHILGHRQFRGQNHTDPGNEWPMAYYIKLVRQYAREQSEPAPRPPANNKPQEPERVMFVYNKRALKSTRSSGNAAAYALKQVGIRADVYTDRENADYSANLALEGKLGQNILVVQGTMAMMLFSGEYKEEFTVGGEWPGPETNDIWDARRNVVQQTRWNIARLCDRAGADKSEALAIFDNVYENLMGKG